MKHILTGISLGLLTLALGALKVVASSEVGIHIEFSDIKNTFSRHVVKYIGECPGEYRYGMAEDGDLRFISRTAEPDKTLKVSLTNLRSGKRIERDYKKTGLGSNDFTLTQLGNSRGSHEIEYVIYDKNTKKSIETGTFFYNVTVSQETKRINANWKIELYCVDDYAYKKKLNECRNIGIRQVKYCNGSRTRDIRNRGVLNLDRKNIEIDLDIH